MGSSAQQTLLQYAGSTQPDPLVAGGSDAELTLVVSNGGTEIVDVSSLVVTFVAGPNAKDFLAAGTGSAIATQVPSGWSASNDGGAVTLTPSGGAGQIGPTGLAFEFGQLAVNGQPGTATVTIDETASSATQPSADRTASIDVPKFPPTFEVSDLTADPLEVAPGGSTSVMWTGSPADYSLDFDPGSGPANVPVGPVGPYLAADLTVFPVIFTLVISLTVQGQDQPLVAQRQIAVQTAPSLRIVDFSGSAGAIGLGETLTLTWQTQLAESCSLQVDGAAGAVAVPVGAGPPASCTVSSADGQVLDVRSADGSTDLGQITLPDPSPSSIAFRLSAQAESVVQDTFGVDLLAPTISIYCKTEGLLTPDPEVYLVWSTQYATDMTIEPDFGSVGATGSQPVADAGDPNTYTYTLTCRGFGGQKQASASTHG